MLSAYFARLSTPIMRLVDVMLSFPADPVRPCARGRHRAGHHRGGDRAVDRRDPGCRAHHPLDRRGDHGPGIHGGRARHRPVRQLPDHALSGAELPRRRCSCSSPCASGRSSWSSAILSFLGLGARPPYAELGMMASQGRDALFFAPHIAMIPSLAIFVIVLCTNMLGDCPARCARPAPAQCVNITNSRRKQERAMSLKQKMVRIAAAGVRRRAERERGLRTIDHGGARGRQRPLRPAPLHRARRLRGAVHARPTRWCRSTTTCRRIKPGLAESWTQSPDGLTYVFKLRQDVKFCDGKPMTARGRGLFDQALDRSRDQVAGALARRQGRRHRRQGRLHGRIQADRAVLRAALPADAELRGGHRQGGRRQARRRFRREGLQRHRPVLLGRLEAARRDAASSATTPTNGARRSTTTAAPRRSRR